MWLIYGFSSLNVLVSNFFKRSIYFPTLSYWGNSFSSRIILYKCVFQWEGTIKPLKHCTTVVTERERMSNVSTTQFQYVLGLCIKRLEKGPGMGWQGLGCRTKMCPLSFCMKIKWKGEWEKCLWEAGKRWSKWSHLLGWEVFTFGLLVDTIDCNRLHLLPQIWSSYT